MTLAALIARFGYLAIVVGTFFEGETVLILGGFAAHRGYLAPAGVVAAAFTGTFAADQALFYLGRWRGLPFLERRPGWRHGAARAGRLIRRHETAVILGFRFLYGIRTVTPFVLGASGVAPLRFALLSAVSALAWAASVGALGYALGSAAQQLLGNVRRYEGWVFAAIVLVGVLAWSAHTGLRRRRPD
jgi:membrane protein DedA with SNARE-associated domain